MRLAAVKVLKPCKIDGVKRSAGVTVLTTDVKSALRAIKAGRAIPLPLDQFTVPENATYECRFKS